MPTFTLTSHGVSAKVPLILLEPSADVIEDDEFRAPQAIAVLACKLSERYIGLFLHSHGAKSPSMYSVGIAPRPGPPHGVDHSRLVSVDSTRANSTLSYVDAQHGGEMKYTLIRSENITARWHDIYISHFWETSDQDDRTRVRWDSPIPRIPLWVIGKLHATGFTVTFPFSQIHDSLLFTPGRFGKDAQFSVQDHSRIAAMQQEWPELSPGSPSTSGGALFPASESTVRSQLRHESLLRCRYKASSQTGFEVYFRWVARRVQRGRDVQTGSVPWVNISFRFHGRHEEDQAVIWDMEKAKMGRYSERKTSQVFKDGTGTREVLLMFIPAREPGTWTLDIDVGGSSYGLPPLYRK